MTLGMVGVVLGSMLFGAAAEMWNCIGRQSKSAFSQLPYASGFLCCYQHAQLSGIIEDAAHYRVMALW